MNQSPIVSVCMITYGHETFIKQAIEGVLFQKCDFDIELIIADDSSRDATDAVVNEIINGHKNGHLIKYYRHESNLGVMPNFIFALQRCKGKFIALCEGDDYWIDPYKLQKQVNFLEANLDYVIHGGDAFYHRADKLTNCRVIDRNENKIFQLQDFYFSNNLVTCTVMFRNILKGFPEIFRKVVFGDWFLYAIVLNYQKNLKAYRSSEVFAVYRQHDASVMGSMSIKVFNENHYKQISQLKKFLNYKGFLNGFKIAMNNYYLSCFKLEIDDKKYFNAFCTLILNFVTCQFKTEFRKYGSYVKHNFKF